MADTANARVRPGRYRMRDGRVVAVTRRLRCVLGGESKDRWEGKLEETTAPNFFVWNDAGQDCASDDRQHDLVRRLPPRFGR